MIVFPTDGVSLDTIRQKVVERHGPNAADAGEGHVRGPVPVHVHDRVANFAGSGFILGLRKGQLVLPVSGSPTRLIVVGESNGVYWSKDEFVDCVEINADVESLYLRDPLPEDIRQELILNAILIDETN